MGIAVLGPLQVDGKAGLLAPRDRVVLSALTVRLGEVVSADQLADALWADDPPATWSKVLQGSVVRLRKALGTDAIETVDHGYRLALPLGEVDLREFERLVARGRELLSLGEAERASYTLGEALALWRGTPLTDVEEWEPGRREAQRLAELRLDAEELQVDAALRAGRHLDVLGPARRLVERAPLRERRWELLALAQYRCGQQADALRTLQQLRHVLAEQLGLDPGPQAAALEQAILRQDTQLSVTAAGTLSPTCPYLGLVPYDVADADSFFGREVEVAACRRRLAESGVLAVVGPSGSGKSSLVRAGLAASLRRDGERVVVVTPGRRPLDALTALPATGPRPVLVVDQAEEAVTLCDDVEESAAFFTALVRHAEHGRLVVALRADRFGDVAASGELARLVEQGLYVLTPMTAQALRVAIEGPARQAGLRLEPGLVELLVAEVEGQPGALPYLSHTLRQTWERREGGVLTIDGYRATGGIRDAVAQSAERVYDELPTEQRALLRDVMLRLVTPGPDGEPVRSRIPRRQLTVDPAHDRILERLVAARLVTGDDGVVELAHEALARAWPRLQGWLDDDTEGQRILRHLSVAADTWESMGRPDDELYRGTRLAQALDWRDRTRPELTPVEAAYLDAGQRRARREEQSALEQAHHQARVNRRLRVLLVGSALLLVAALVAGGLAVVAANRATESGLAANARRVTAQAQLTDRVDRSLALAVAAMHVEPSAEARAGLLAALARTPQLVAVRPFDGLWVDVAQDGRTVAGLAGDNRLVLHDLDTLRPVGSYDPFPARWDLEVGGNLSPVAFDPRGERVAFAVLNVHDSVVRILDAATLRPLPRQPGGQPQGAHPSDVELSADGRFLAVSVASIASGGGHFTYLWDLERPARPVRRIRMPSDTFYVEFSADGRRLLAAPAWNSDAPPGLWVYDLRTGRLREQTPDGGHGLEISDDGSMLAYADGSSVVVAAAGTGKVQQTLSGPQDLVQRVALSDDGELVAAVSDDESAWVWETATGLLVERVPLPGAAVSLDFAAGGERLVVPVTGRLLVLDLTGRERYVPRTAASHAAGVLEGGAFRFASPYAPAIAESTYDPELQGARLRVIDRRTGRPTPLRALGWLGNIVDAHTWAPNGRHLAVVDWRERLRVLDWRTGEVVVQRPYPGDELRYTTDGRELFAVGPDGMELLDATSLRPATRPVSLPARRIVKAVLGPRDRTAVVVTAGLDGDPLNAFGAARRWALVDLGSGDVIREGALRRPAVSLAVSPDRSRAAVAGAGGVEIVDLRTGTVTTSADSVSEVESAGLHVTFSPDGALLASSDSTGRVSLWDGRTGALLGTVHPGDAEAAPLFLDDRRLLLPFVDGATYVWDTSVAHAVETACRVLGRGLTRTEWAAAFGSRPYEDVC